MKKFHLGLLFCSLLPLSIYGQQPVNPDKKENTTTNSNQLKEEKENFPEPPWDKEDKSALKKMIRDRNYPGHENGLSRFADEMASYRDGHPEQLAANWSYINASGNGDVGRAGSITIDTVNTGRFYVCTPHSGVWLTNDNGLSYTPITESLPTQATSCLVIDPSNTDILYLATGTHNMDMPRNSMGIYKSTDGGSTWNITGLAFQASAAFAIGELIINPQQPSTLLAATTDGLYRTWDAGATWTKILIDGVNSVRYKPGDTTIVYTVGSAYYRSDDGGNLFTQIVTGIYNSYQWHYEYFVRTAAFDPNVLYLITAGGWANPFFNTRLYVHKSTDSGLTFSMLDSLFGEVCEQVDVSQTTADKMVIGYRATFKKDNSTSPIHQVSQTTSGGAFPYMHADQRGISFDPLNDQIIYYCNDGGLYRSIDDGVTFQNITANMQLAHHYTMSNSQDTSYKILVSPLDVNPYTIGNNGIDKTFWQLVESFSSHLNPVNDSIFYLTHQTPLFTQDDGSTFYTSTSPLIGNTSFHIHNFQFNDCEENVSYYVSYNDIFKSVDYGHTYNKIASTTYNAVNGFQYEPQGFVVSRANPDYVYVYYIDSVYVTKTGNSQFYNITAGLPAGAAAISNLVVDPANEKNIWVSFSGYSAGNKVFHSSDAGQTWTNISTGIPNIPVNVLACQHGITGSVYAGTDGGVFYIDSSFATWQYYNTGLPNVLVTALDIQYDIGKIRAGTFGRGVWESDLYQLTPATYVLPPVALLTASSAYACPGEPVSFINTSCGDVDSVLWLFPGGTPASSTSNTPLVSYAVTGNYTITLIAWNAGGTDTLVRTDFLHVDPATALPWYEPVANLNQLVLPAGFRATDANGDSASWNRGYWTDGYSGPNDDYLYFDNYFVNLGGLEENLIFPPFDLSGTQHPKFYFYRSYARRDAVSNDTLKVYAKSCGGTDTLLYINGGAQLANIPGFYSANYWQPSFPSDWVADSVDLTVFAGQPYVTLTMANRGYYGGIVYIDELLLQNTTVPAGISDNSSSAGITVFPNPAKDVIHIRSVVPIYEMYLTDPLGRSLLKRYPGISQTTLDISSLAAGIYFLHINDTVRRIEKF